MPLPTWQTMPWTTLWPLAALKERPSPPVIPPLLVDLLTGFLNFEKPVEPIVGDDSTAIVQWRDRPLTGGSFLGNDPNGRHIEIRGVDAMETTEGTLRFNTISYDGTDRSPDRDASTGKRERLRRRNALAQVAGTAKQLIGFGERAGIPWSGLRERI